MLRKWASGRLGVLIPQLKVHRREKTVLCRRTLSRKIAFIRVALKNVATADLPDEAGMFDFYSRDPAAWGGEGGEFGFFSRSESSAAEHTDEG